MGTPLSTAKADASLTATAATDIANAASETATKIAANASFDVFLSFRGEIRNNFITHLYKALTEKGINTFKDDKKLDQGETISPALLEAIKKSKFCLVVLSKDYASSSWCLQELEKITERIPDAEKDKETDVKKDSKTVLPIFYDVDPSDVRKQKGTFGVGFVKSKKKCPAKEQDWKSALTKVANQSGWVARNRDEVILIDEIVIFILKKLTRTSSNKMPSHLVGMESRVKDMESRLRMELDNVRMVGIWGMPGIGKTTIAKAVYDSINCKFDSCCFLHKVGEVAGKSGFGIPYLQEQLVSKLLKDEIRTIRLLGDNFEAIKKRFKNRRVLIVLDDVDNGDQLQALVGEHKWFGHGSRIIITTTNYNLLLAHEVDETYKPAPLEYTEAIWLFTHHSIKKSHSIDKFTKFMELSYHMVKYCEGVPKALQVLGSFLVDKDELEWESELQKLQTHPNMQILEVYEKIYDHGLDWPQKEMFLDIACFFNGEDQDYVVKVLEGFGHFSRTDLKVLVHRCIITDSDNKFWMNGLLQKMGQHIVHRQSPQNPGLRSRLWSHNDVCRVLEKNKATENIMGIVLDLSKIGKLHIDTEVFWTMKNLKLLKIYFADHSVDFEYHVQKRPFASINFSEGTDALRLPNPPVKLYGELITLSDDLVCLHWHGYPLECLPRKFYPQQLVELNMPCSRIRRFWTKPKYFKKLKYIKLNHSQKLTVTPDFSGMPNLEILILEGCTNLVEVHQSLSYLERLVFLNLKDCSSLQKLPSEISMIRLEVLVLSGCSKLKTFPDIKGDMRSLSELHLDDTAIDALPESITQLKGLVLLSARNCKYLKHLPSSFGRLKRLKTINLSGCTHFDQLLEKLKWLKNLEELYVEGVTITEIPLSICHYAELKILSFRRCENFPFVNAAQTLQEETRENFSPYFYGSLYCLTSLDLSYCRLKEVSIPEEFGKLSSLKKLNLSGNHFLTLPSGTLARLENLEVISLSDCTNLVSLPSFPSKVYRIDAQSCPQLVRIVPSRLKGLCRSSFNFMNCFYLRQVYGEKFQESAAMTALELLKYHIHEVPSHFSSEFSIIVPGGGIPVLDEYELRSSSVRINLPGDWYGESLCGIALWAVFEVDDLDTLAIFNNDTTMQMQRCLEFYFMHKNSKLISDTCFVVNRGTVVVSEHLWLRYIPSSVFKMTREQGRWSQLEAVFLTRGEGLRVKKCGIYPMCLKNGKVYSS